MVKSPSTIIIPVENQVRELDAKILLSCVAVERGFPVLIGSRAYIHFKVDSVPRGVYLAKSMKTRSIRMFKLLNNLGHDVVAWDEEGLLREPDHVYHRWRLSSVAIKRVAHLIAWGENNACSFRAFLKNENIDNIPITIAGNPRFDLLRPELREYYRPEAETIRERYGDFILINTNFSKVNHYYSPLGELKKAVETSDSGKVDPYDAGKGRHKIAIFEQFLKMLPEFCKEFSDHTVVLRPHPSENQGPWLEIARNHHNLKVCNDGNVHPWLLAAKTVVANGCTTLVESAILDVPAVNFEPEVADEYDFEITRAVSHRVFTREELYTKVRAIVDGKLGPLELAKRRAGLDPHIAALEGRLSADRFIDLLIEAGYADSTPPLPPFAERFKAKLENKARTIEKLINMRRPGHRNNIALHDHRYPGISAGEMQKVIDQFGSLLNRFQDIKVKSHSKHLYWLYK